MYQLDKNFCPVPETKADPFSLDALIAWLEQRDPVEQYNSSDFERCLLCQFVGGNWSRVTAVLPNRYEDGFDQIAHRVPMGQSMFDTSAPDFCTMGKALERARAYQARP